MIGFVLSACGGQPTEDTDSSSLAPTIALSPVNPSIAANGSQVFTASGGTAPYTFAVISGGGTITASGTYTAPATPTTAEIGATDSTGATAKTNVIVNGPVVISPTTLTIGVNGTRNFSATGGKTPYTFSKVSGVGASTAAGVYTAGTTPGSASVKVTDSLGQSATAAITVNTALSISPATANVGQSGTLAFTAGGGVAPYSFAIGGGGGTVGSTNGAFTAPAAPGTVTVKVTDSSGASVDATVTVVGPVAIAPASYTMAVDNMKTLTASGGSGPYVFAIASGGGSINSSTGAYIAPSTAGSATVKVTDSSGQSATAAVTINPALSISPVSVTLAPNGTRTFSSTGGVSPYTFSIVSGGGSIVAASGAFTAPAMAGSVTVKVTDALMNTATATVTVVNPLTIAPTAKTLAVNNSASFTAAGGQTPYTYSVQTGSGTVNASTGAYTAGASAGSAVVRVTDSVGAHADAAVTINAALTISPLSTTLAASGTKTFSAAGGLGPYTFSVASGGGSINSSSGAYTASASAGNSSVQVTDALGNTATATVTVVDAASISPVTSTLPANGAQIYSAAGGAAPYVFSIVSGGGSIDSATGAFTAPATAGSVSVKVVDSVGQSATATVTVASALTVSPGAVTLAVNNTKTFSASGGQSPYSFSVKSGGGVIGAASGVYTAPASAGSAVIEVADAIGQKATANVTVNAGLSVSPATATLAANGTATFSAAGGVAPYAFSITSGGGSINAGTGAFTAPANAGGVSVQVADALGNTTSAAVTVLGAVTISPATVNLAVSNTVTFSASGGQTPYTFSMNAGGGSVDSSSGAYTAPASAGSATVRVTDGLGQTADAAITVNSGISISPATVTLAFSGTHTFSATGGVAPYSFAVSAGGGSVNSSGVYTAGTSAGSATVQVSDSLGNTSSAAVVVVAPVTLAPTTATLATNGTRAFSASGGQTPYTYSITSGGGSINSSTGALTAGTSAGSVTVQAVDSIGQSATAAVTVVDGVIIAPSAFTLAVNNSKTFGVSGGQGPYTFSLQSGGGGVDASTGVYSAPASAGTAVVVATDSLGQTATANVIVNAAISLAPATLTLATHGTSTFTAAGGVTPYSFSITSGGGSIDASSGVLTAPASAGSVLIRVSDALGNIASATVTVVAPVLIAPATVTLAAGNSTSFSTSGGLAPYSYSVQTGGGNINSASGVYTAAASAGSAVVRVTDSLGQTADAAVTVNSALTISPVSATLAFSTLENFTAAGGVGPYSFAVKTGGGSVNASGAYTASTSAGSASVEVTDSLGNTASAAVTVVAPVSLSPLTATLAANGAQAFSASGGQTPYTFSIVSGGGNIGASTGAFTAPASAGSVSVKVVDAIGQSATANVDVVSAPALSPANITLAVSGSATFSGSGGQAPYTFTVQSGGGSVDAAGVFTAPASPGSAVIQIADALGQTATANVTINPALSISPVAVTLAQNGTASFSAAGGVSPYTYSVVSGGGAIGASSGAFTAPASSGTVAIRVTDSLGNTAGASVTVVAPVSITPAAVTLAILNSTTLSASGGLGPYTFNVQSGGGAVGSSTGFYTAGAAAGAAVVRVTDSLGQSADAGITVNGAISIAPVSVTLAYGAAQSFSASGGVTPYSYSISSGGGSIGGSTGAYTSPATAGAATVKVSDALGNMASANVTVVSPVTITPLTTMVTVNGNKSFAASGGLSPYTYAVLSGGGSINASGVYTAPATASSVAVQVTDAIGQTASANIGVVPVLAISPVTYSMAIGNSKTFAASGGQTPYTFSVQSGGGSIDSSTGAYTGPATAGSAVIAVSDASGQTASANVAIVSGLTISPTALTLAVNNASTFSASGGVTPYVFSIASGGGTINASTGAFTAPATAGSVSVRVSDSIGNTSTATVTVNSALSLSPASTTLASGGTLTLSAAGGTGGNVFSIVSGGGSIVAASGAFTAPAGPATVSVKVTDSFGNTATGSVSVAAPLTLAPAAATLAVNNTQAFAASGGQTPYSYSMQSGGGSIDASGSYVAPATSGTAVVKVTDALGSTATANVTINAALAISPAALSMAVNGSQTFTASGGTGGNVFSIVSGGGSIVAATGAFTAPATAASVTVRVTDSKGNIANAAITVVNVLSISPASFTLAVNNTKSFTTAGGQSPYTYSVQSGTGTINAAGLYAAPAASGSAVIKVQDASGQSATANVTVNAALTITPVSTTVGASGTKSFTGGGGVTPYTFSVVSGGGSVTSAGVYTAPSTAGSATIRITDALNNTADAAVSVLNGVQITPATLAVAVGNSYTFSASGGQTPYTFAKVSGAGAINATTGAFTAGSNSGTTVVKVTDSLGQTASATITVNPALTLSPANWGMTVGTTKAFTASGGAAPYTYAVLIGTGTINSSGLFSAPAIDESETIQVTDSMGNTASAVVEVYMPLTLSPSPGYVFSGNVLSMSASGGDGVYNFEILSGVGTIDAAEGDYTAPSSPGTAVIRVTDGAGSSAQATVTTYDQLNLTPNAVTVGPGNTYSFAATGGLGALTFSMVSGTGSINSETGVYSAPATAGVAVVKVTDSIGNTDTSNITVTAALTISPTTFYMGPAESKTFTAANGLAPITFSIASGGGTINPSTGVFVSPTTPDTLTVVATDSIGNTSTSTVTIVAPARLATGGAGNCVTYSDGAVRCWGQNNYGQAGVGTSTNYGGSSNQMGINLPWAKMGTGRTAKMLVRGLYHTCAILDNDKVKCWGRNNMGQLGLGSTATVGTSTATMGDALAYVNLGTGRTAKKIFAGIYHTCAILDNDSLKCWGYNAYGQLGQNNTTNYGSGANQMGDSLPAINLGTGRTAKSVAMGYYHTCVQLDNNTLKCFGRSNYGQLGYGNTSSVGNSSGQMAALATVNVGTGRTVKAITGALYHTCAIRDDNKTVCWGRNNVGQLGLGISNSTWGGAANQMGDSLPAVNLGTGRSAVAVVSHYSHTCAQLDNGAMKCWGENGSGQLGIGSTSDRGASSSSMGDNLPPVDVGTGINLSTISTGSANSCFLTLEYRVKCWGSAGSGALGNGTTQTSYGTSSSTMGNNLPFVGL